MIEITSMHDWVLSSVTFEWGAGRTLFILKDDVSTYRLVAEGVFDLHVPRSNEWGASNAINEVNQVSIGGKNQSRLCIEMQSGDVIVIDAKTFTLVKELD